MADRLVFGGGEFSVNISAADGHGVLVRVTSGNGDYGRNRGEFFAYSDGDRERARAELLTWVGGQFDLCLAAPTFTVVKGAG